MVIQIIMFEGSGILLMPLFFVCFVLCSDKLVCVFVYMGKNLFVVVFPPISWTKFPVVVNPKK